MEQGPQSEEAVPSSLKSRVSRLMQKIRNLVEYLCSPSAYQSERDYLKDYDDWHVGQATVAPLSKEPLGMADRHKAKRESGEVCNVSQEEADLRDYGDWHRQVTVVPLSRELLEMADRYKARRESEKGYSVPQDNNAWE